MSPLPRPPKKKDADDDSSLDFLPHHNRYKTFAKLTQDECFDKCKEKFSLV